MWLVILLVIKKTGVDVHIEADLSSLSTARGGTLASPYQVFFLIIPYQISLHSTEFMSLCIPLKSIYKS